MDANRPSDEDRLKFVATMVARFKAIYLPRLSKEAPDRVEFFLQAKLCQYDEILTVMGGEDYIVKQDAMRFLRMARRSGIKLPKHLDVFGIEAADLPPAAAGDSAGKIMLRAIESADASFFAQMASLMRKAPVNEDFGKYLETVRSRRARGIKLFGTNEQRGRNYLQRLILAVTEILIDEDHRLPTIAEIREVIASLLPGTPPRLNQVMEALSPVGLLPPVLDDR